MVQELEAPGLETRTPFGEQKVVVPAVLELVSSDAGRPLRLVRPEQRRGRARSRPPTRDGAPADAELNLLSCGYWRIASKRQERSPGPSRHANNRKNDGRGPAHNLVLSKVCSEQGLCLRKARKQARSTRLPDCQPT